MAIRVFISSTRQDLDTCRNAVIEAIHVCEGASTVNMENRVAEFRNSVEECYNMINDSTHCVSIIAYRRGWLPDKNNPENKSITEIEFEHAKERLKQERMGIFLPEPPISEELRKAANHQSDSDAKAQQAFIERIRNAGFYMTFKNTEILSAKVAKLVYKWVNQSSFRNTKSYTQSSNSVSYAADNNRDMARPSENIIQLGRVAQVQQFEQSLERLQNSSLTLACFLIHGLGGNGHEEMVIRLCQVLTQKRYIQPGYYHYQVAMDVSWRRQSLAELLELIGREMIGTRIHPEWTLPRSPEELANKLQEVLETKDVILVIKGIQRFHRFNDSLAGFVEDFWHPFIRALNQPLLYQLVVLLTLEGTIFQEWQSLVQDPLIRNHDSAIYENCPIQLPELSSFTQEELTSWLSEWLPPNQALQRSQSLMYETQGNPNVLYNMLRNDDSFWS